jgi:hypothetical protein
VNPHQNEVDKIKGGNRAKRGNWFVRNLPLAILFSVYCYDNRDVLVSAKDVFWILIVPVVGFGVGMLTVYRFRFLEIDDYRTWGCTTLAVILVYAVWQGVFYLLKTSGISEQYATFISIAVGMFVLGPAVALTGGCD